MFRKYALTFCNPVDENLHQVMLSIVSEEFVVSRRRQIIRALKGVGLLLGLAVIAGCATPPVYPTKQATECEYKAAKEGVTVGVHPVFDEQELLQYFNTDLVNRSILPVLVVVQNTSADTSVLLIKTNCTLTEAAGFAGKDNLPTRSAAIYIPGGLIGTAIFLDAETKRTAIGDKELNDQTISPGESGQGFVYFEVPKERPAKGASLSVQVRLPRIGTDQRLDFDLPISWER